MATTAHDWDPEAQHERKKEQTEEATALQAGAAEAQQMVPHGELMTKEFVDEVTDPDVDRALPDEDPAQHNVETLMGAQLSKQLALGYISKEDYYREREKDKGRKLLLKQQFRDPAGGGGCECTGRSRERLTGGSSTSRSALDEDLDAQIDGAFESKDSLRSGAVDGRKSRSVTEAHVVTRNESSSRSSSDSDGILGRATSKLFGG